MNYQDANYLLSHYNGHRPSGQSTESQAQVGQRRWEMAAEFFNPIFTFFDEVHLGPLLLFGFGGGPPRKVPSGETFKDLVFRHRLPPQYIVQLNETTTLTVDVVQRLTARERLRGVTHNWRFVVRELGHGDDIRSSTRRAEILHWIVTTLVDHSIPDSIPKRLGEGQFEDGPTDEMSRVILLDPTS